MYFTANISLMIRELVSEAIQKKYFLMFLTAAVYIFGLFAFYLNFGAIAAGILLVLGLILILRNYISPALVLFWYLVFFFAFFNANLRINKVDYLYKIAPAKVTLEGQISSIPKNGLEDKTKFFFNVKKINYGEVEKELNLKTYVTLFSNDGEFSKFNVGDYYKIKGKLQTPFEATNPSQFDYGKYLKNFNTFSVFYANKNSTEKLDIKLTPRWNFLNRLNGLRNNIIKAHSKYLKSPNIEVLGGIVFGDDAVSPPEYIKKNFINSGLLHILAASGMNVALIYGIWFFILSKLKVPFKLRISSGIFIILFYALMTGLGPSVIRATFMLIFILVGKLIDRDAHNISLLSFVALLMLIYNPAFINDIGFQLSFVVTFGLLLTAPVLFDKFKDIKFFPNWLSGAIFVPIIAQIWVAPIQMYYFNTFSTYSIFANILSVPLVSIISFGGFISSVLAIFRPIADIVCRIFNFFLKPVITLLVNVSNYFSSLPNSLLTTIEPNAVQIAFYYLLIISLTLLLKKTYTKQFLTLAMCSVLGILISSIHVDNKNFETIAFDVQNADAFLIKTPESKYFIIDTGKPPYKKSNSQAQYIILSYLKDKGIKQIEGLVITHFDSDHAGGAIDLIENLEIKSVYMNSLKDESALAQKIYQSIENKNIKATVAKNNEKIYEERNFKIKTFISNIEDNDNENSVITLVSHKDFDELFMGDAGEKAFEKVKNEIPRDIEILKVGHHGAKDVLNQEILSYLLPKIAIISTGQNNYGHPNSYILNLLETNGIKTFRTDKKKAIKIAESNSKFDVFSYEPSKEKFIKQR